MASYAHRRQVLLFLVAVVLPCTVLVVLGVRLISQERELRESRLADERRLITRQVRQELSVRLDDIKQNEATRLQADARQILTTQFTDSAVVLVARLRNGSLVFPWAQSPDAEQARSLLFEEPFARSIAEGERAEFAAGEAREAVTAYEEALQVARHPVQQIYARLLLGRASSMLGRELEAMRHYRAVLASPSAVTDEFGIALWSYAAARLLETRNTHSDVLDRLSSEIGSGRWYPPAQLYLFRALVDTVTARAADTSIATQVQQLSLRVLDRISTVETVLALKSQLASLPISLDPSTGTQGSWVLWEEVDWLVGVTSSIDEQTATLVAVRTHDIFESLEVIAASEIAAPVVLAVGPEADGELLGAEFPGLKIQFSQRLEDVFRGSWSLRRWFYLAAVLLVVSATLFGAYLLWRDVQRELKVAEMRSRFVSSVSHELKTPLTAIRMFAETLRLRVTNPETQVEYLDTIVSESERLTRLLNNVLDFAKIERGTKIYSRESHALGEIVQSTARAMQYPLEQKQFDLRVDINESIPPMNVDRDAIEQAILNLLTNAMKYSGENRDIELRLRKVDSEAIVEVADRGVGIAPEEQTRIFDQFYRARTPDNQNIPGTGLGLTLVDHIAKAHDGYVTVESQPGKGSTFSIHLPLEGGDA